MGVIGKLAFWRKSGGRKQSNLVTTFEEPSEGEGSARKASSPHGGVKVATPTTAGTVGEALTTAAESWQAACNPQDDEVEPTAAKLRQTSSASIIIEEPRPPPKPRSPPATGSSRPLAGEASPAAAAGGNSPVAAAKVASAKASAAPVYPDLADEDRLTLDIPFEQIVAGVSQAFGPMICSSLQSTKWDKRAQALKAAGTMLCGRDIEGMAAPGSTGVLGRGLGPKGRVRCWRSSCQVLHHILSIDKVMPVRLAAHDLFVDTFTCAGGLVSEEEIQLSFGVLFEHIIDRLGDSNTRLHDSARKCVLFSVEHQGLFGLDAVLSRLKSRLDTCHKHGERAKVHHGVLDTVNMLLQHFPGRREEDDDLGGEEANDSSSSWTQDDIAPFIVAGMDDSLGSRVRADAVTLAVTVYQTFGMEALQPLLESLRPAKQVLLRQKFKESEELDCDEFATQDGSTPGGTFHCTPRTTSELAGLVVCGTAVRAAKPVQLPGSANADHDEESLMDGILEETGMVFGGGMAIDRDEFEDLHLLDESLLPGPATTPFGASVHDMVLDDLEEEEQRLLEEELNNIDMDMGGVDEQEVLLRDCLSAVPLEA